MTAIAFRPDKTELIRKVLALAHTLRLSAEGVALSDQLERGNRERASIHDSVERAFLAFAYTLLHQYTKNSKSDPATRVRAILIQQRIAPFLERGEVAIDPDNGGDREPDLERSWLSPTFEQHIASVLWSVRNLTPLPPAQKNTATRQDAARPAARGTNNGPEAPRAGTDRVSAELDSLATELGAELKKAAAESLDFVAHIKTASLALLRAEGEEEVKLLRDILVGTADELIQGHASLQARLRGASDILGKVREIGDTLRSESDQERAISLTDALTGIPNRAAFMRRLVAETGRAQRHGYPLALAILDPDRLEDIGRADGGGATDEVMRCYARNILGHFRAYDMVARYGKGEFAVLLPNTGPEQAVSALHKARHRVSSTFYLTHGKRLQAPTFSSGLAWYVAGERPWNLLERAGQALHRAKRSGTGRIEAGTK